MNESDVIDRLRAVRPSSVLAVLTDGSTVRVAVPSKGQRWSRVWGSVSKLPWQELRALNHKGELLDVVARDPQGLEDLSIPATAAGGLAGLVPVMAAFQTNMTRTIIEGMRAAREQAGAELGQILDAHRQLAADAFTLRNIDRDELDRVRQERDELREQLAAAAQGSSGEVRERMLMELFERMGSKKLPPAPKSNH